MQLLKNIEDDKNKIQKTDLFNSIQLLLEKLPIPVAVINKKKIIRGFNTLAKEEFDLKSNFNIAHIIRNPIFVNSVNVAIKKNVKKFLDKCKKVCVTETRNYARSHLNRWRRRGFRAYFPCQINI